MLEYKGHPCSGFCFNRHSQLLLVTLSRNLKDKNNSKTTSSYTLILTPNARKSHHQALQDSNYKLQEFLWKTRACLSYVQIRVGTPEHSNFIWNVTISNGPVWNNMEVKIRNYLACEIEAFAVAARLWCSGHVKRQTNHFLQLALQIS